MIWWPVLGLLGFNWTSGFRLLWLFSVDPVVESSSLFISVFKPDLYDCSLDDGWINNSTHGQTICLNQNRIHVEGYAQNRIKIYEGWFYVSFESRIWIAFDNRSILEFICACIQVLVSIESSSISESNTFSYINFLTHWYGWKLWHGQKNLYIYETQQTPGLG